nr:arylsulfatase [Flammeovirga kamogawensis]
MNKLTTILSVLTLLIFWSCQKNTTTTSKEKKPNIIFVYLDDLGYGDLSSYGGDISTPNIDNMANGGVRFTNAYASSATCTPSRYAAFTGIYPWREKDAKILPGTAPMLIGKQQMTVPKMLREQGYETAIIGKWHMGLGNGQNNWNEHISPNPNDVGFDYSFIMAATQDRVPTVFIENGNVVGLDKNDPIEINYNKNFPGQTSGKENPELTTMKWHHGHNSSIINGIPRIGYMKGGKAAIWDDQEMTNTFLGGVKEYIHEHKSNDKPFFLAYTMQQPHVPRTPHPDFIGKSGKGPRGDVIMEADWAIGELMKTLEKEGIAENTLIIFSSDNGPVLNDGYYDDAVEKLGNHKPSGNLKGGKYSLFDAGTHVPFITYWKGTIQPKVSDALVCQLDILSSLAGLTGSNITTKDSEDMLNAFLGKTTVGRSKLILEANTKTLLREGDWVMIPPYQGPKVETQVNIELGNADEFQLYNIKEDPSQNNNLAQTNKKKLQEMINSFEKVRGNDYQKVEQLELK